MSARRRNKESARKGPRCATVCGFALINAFFLVSLQAAWGQNKFYDTPYGQDQPTRYDRRRSRMDRDTWRQMKIRDAASASYERDKSRYGDWKNDPEMQKQFAEFGKSPEDPGFDWRQFHRFIGRKQMEEQNRARNLREKQGLRAVMAKKARISLESARRTGNKTAAAHDYAIAAKVCRDYPGVVPGENELSLLSKAADIYASINSREGRTHWQRLTQIDPSNPKWPYLLGQSYLQSGLDTLELSERNFKKAVAATGGNPRYRLQAKQKLAQFPALYKKRAAIQKEIARRRRNTRRSPFSIWTGGGSSSSSGSSSSNDSSGPAPIPSWERQAREAEARGDYSAADRFRGGGASGEDSARYWGY